MSSSRHVQIVVLAGGAGTRMGAPKATAPLGGRALIEYPVEALAASFDTVVVAKPHSELPKLGVPVWEEPSQPSHPLVGIVTALERAGGPVVVCACDMPFVSADLVGHLAGLDVPLTLPQYGGRLHPLLARYEPSLIDELRGALAQERSLHQTVESLRPQLLAESELAKYGDPERFLLNVNTPADLQRAQTMLDG